VIETIERPDDERVADYAYVGDAAWLRDRELFVAEGRLVVKRLLESQRFVVRSVLVTPAAAAALQSTLDLAGCAVYVCDHRTIAAVSGINFHRGCVAIAERPGREAGGPFPQARCLLALEGVGNPDNIGGLFRVAAAFETGGVLLDRTSGDPWYRKAIRTSMGAILTVPFRRADPWMRELQALRGEGFQLVALTPDPSATALQAYARTLSSEHRLVLMVGGEGPGLSGESLGAADIKVRIPIAADVDSLNVVVAAGIGLAALS
jgi:tRNA G18 (ribose-2'-O)-methylase SpoU